jgi:hypothetical protein
VLLAQPFVPRAEHRVASGRSPPAVKTAAGHNLELTALRRHARGRQELPRLRSAKLELQMVPAICCEPPLEPAVL